MYLVGRQFFFFFFFAACISKYIYAAKIQEEKKFCNHQVLHCCSKIRILPENLHSTERTELEHQVDVWASKKEHQA